MNIEEPTDKEVLNTLLDGGVRLCDYAIEQWESGKYRSTPEDIASNRRRWRSMKDRMREIVNDLKAKAGK